MLKWLMHRLVAAFERQWQYDAAFMHDLIDTDPRAAWAFRRATALGRYRRVVPPDALAAASLTAVRMQDCGPCTQLGVAMAERAGVGRLGAACGAQGGAAAMPEPVALFWRFTRATLMHDPAADRCRDDIERRWGRQAVVSLAFAILTARVYPTVTYAMGHGTACARVIVGGAPVSVGALTAAAE